MRPAKCYIFTLHLVVGPMKYRFLILTVSLLLVLGYGLSAQETSPRVPVVLEITLPSKTMDELHLQDVISRAIRLELERAGMEVIPISEALDLPVGSVVEASQDIDIGEVFDLASSLGADYVLFTIYSRYENEIRLDCTFNDVRKRSLAAIASKSRRMGLWISIKNPLTTRPR